MPSNIQSSTIFKSSCKLSVNDQMKTFHNENIELEICAYLARMVVLCASIMCDPTSIKHKITVSKKLSRYLNKKINAFHTIERIFIVAIDFFLICFFCFSFHSPQWMSHFFDCIIYLCSSHFLRAHIFSSFLNSILRSINCHPSRNTHTQAFKWDD